MKERTDIQDAFDLDSNLAKALKKYIDHSRDDRPVLGGHARPSARRAIKKDGLILASLFALGAAAACNKVVEGTEEVKKLVTSAITPNPTKEKATETPAPTSTPEPEYLGIGGSYEQNPKQWDLINKFDAKKLVLKLETWLDAWIKQTGMFAKNSKSITIDFLFDDPNDPELVIPYLTVYLNDGSIIKYTVPKGDYDREAPITGPGQLLLGDEDGPMSITSGGDDLWLSVGRDEDYKLRVLRKDDLGRVIQRVDRQTGFWEDVDKKLTEEEIELIKKFAPKVSDVINNPELHLVEWGKFNQLLESGQLAELIKTYYNERLGKLEETNLDFYYSTYSPTTNEIIAFPNKNNGRTFTEHDALGSILVNIEENENYPAVITFYGTKQNDSTYRIIFGFVSLDLLQQRPKMVVRYDHSNGRDLWIYRFKQVSGDRVADWWFDPARNQTIDDIGKEVENTDYLPKVLETMIVFVAVENK